MSRCGRTKDLFLDSLYGELDPGREAGLMKHLDVCPDCREEYEAMARTLVTMGRREAADPGAAYWDGYYGDLERRMAAEGVFAPAPQTAAKDSPARDRAPFVRIPRLAFGAMGAVALLAAGILIGRLTLDRARPAGSVAAAAAGGTAVVPAAAASDLSLRTSRYIDRSKVILLALVNFDGVSKDIAGLNLPRQKEMSQALVKEASGLKGDLKAAKERQLERLVADLELILVQIANLKAEADLSSVEIIKAGAASKDILFQINLSEMRRADDKSRPAPKAGPGAPAGKPAAKI
jgi:hypothetical protein